MIPVISIFAALALPVIMIWRRGKRRDGKLYLFSVGSFLFCGIALLQELFAIRYRLSAGDFGGLEDTIGAVIVICVVLLIVVVLLNWLAMALPHEQGKETIS